MKVLGTFPLKRWKSTEKRNNESYRQFSNRYVRKIPENGKMKVLGTFFNEGVGKVPKNGKGKFYILSNGYIGKVPINGK